MEGEQKMMLKNVLISMIIFSLFVTTGVLIMGNINTNYSDMTGFSNMTTGKFENISDTIDETYGLSSDMKTEALDADLEGEENAWDSTVKGSYSAVRKLTTPLTTVGGIVNEIADQIGIASYIVTFAITIIIITIVFGIVYLIFRFRG